MAGLKLLSASHSALGHLTLSSHSSFVSRLHGSSVSPLVKTWHSSDPRFTVRCGSTASLDLSEENFKLDWLKSLGFDPSLPVEEAETLPSGWYTSTRVAQAEMRHVFGKGWLAVGHGEQVPSPGDFFTGSVGPMRYVVCRDEAGTLRAFHNVCRHHAAAVACGAGTAQHFQCPYHGWTYGLDGRLQKVTQLKGIKNFSTKDHGLRPLETAQWGPFILLRQGADPMEQHSPHPNPSAEPTVEQGSPDLGEEWLGNAAPVLEAAGVKDPKMRHVERREYEINCNWKVFSDNFLDGGYHVPFAHQQSLANELDVASYDNYVLEKCSVQTCSGSENDARVGKDCTYAYIYPNFMISRYGPWMDTNIVLPLGPSKCKVIFDWFLHEDAPNAKDQAYIDESIHASHTVQVEDVEVCERVQEGLLSPAYDVGRYSPKLELPMHHFHCLLYKDLAPSVGAAP